MALMLLLQLCIALFSCVCHGTIFQRFEDLPAGVVYDFVIVGGGIGGSVTANRLTENPQFKVLVIEAGPTNEGVENLEVPFFALGLGNSAFDWNYTITPQTGLNGRSFPYARGHVLGGSSSINAMFYTRGSSSDFNRWAAVTGDPGWSWNNMLPFILKNEKFVPPADHHSTVGQFNPVVHSFTGINSVSLPGFPQAIDDRVIQTTRDLKDEFPFNLDMNGGTPLGLGWLQATIENGTRSSAATSYLAAKFTSRPNLNILLNTRVTRILQTGTSKNLTFRTVEIVSEHALTGPIHTMTAAKELILSAGSIGTPHILLSSGIGDKAELKAVGVKFIVNLPSVGKNLTEQPTLSEVWFANSTNTTDNLNNNATLLAEALAQWEASHTGPLVDTFVNQVAWLRLPNNSPIFKVVADPSSGDNTPHYELAISNGGGFTPIPGHFVGAGASVVTPASRGSVKLNTSNPLDNPLIDLGLLTSDFDLFAMREAVASTRRFFAGPAWKDYVLQPAGSFANATDDTKLNDFIRNTAFSSAHPVGTAAMSAEDASYGVVNPDLLVKGIQGLRIVDASIMPFITCGHTQAPTYAIAERASDLIKSAWES